MNTEPARLDVHSLGFGEHQLAVADEADGRDEYCPVCDVTWPCLPAEAFQAGRKRGFAEAAAWLDGLSSEGHAARVVRRYAQSNLVTDPERAR